MAEAVSSACQGTEPSLVVIPNLTNKQVQRLLSLIETPKDGYEKLLRKTSWMFDSGASWHMTGDLTMLQEIHGAQPISIGLPNGTYTLASKQGTMRLRGKMKLSNVLFVPSLKCNLVFIAKICKELNCAVTFFEDFCLLQDRTLRTPIGVGEQQDGVHYFK